MNWKGVLKQSNSALFDINEFIHHKNHPKFSRFEATLNDANTAFLNQDYQANSQAFKEAKQILEEMKNDSIQKFFRRKPGSSNYVVESKGGITVGGKVVGNDGRTQKYYINGEEVKLPYFKKILQVEGKTLGSGTHHYLTGVSNQTLSQVPKDYTAGGAF